MIKIWALYIIILFPVFIFSQRLPNGSASKKDSLLPGISTSISFTLENAGEENRTYDITVNSSSPHITPILAKGEITLSGYEKTVYIVPLRIATEAAQGVYSISLEGKDQRNGNHFTKTTEITVSGNRNLSLVSLESPEFIRAGDTIHASFLLKNSGNVTESLFLESKNAVVDENTSLILPPGETKIVTIHKATNPELGQNEYQNLNLSVYSQDNPSENQTAYVSIKIISVKPVENDIYHRLPIAASLAFIGMENMGRYHDGFQGEIYGKGSLDEENKNKIEFHAVSKNPVEFNSFTQYEEYFINYNRNNFFIHLGDKNYSASYLTEFARYGRGAELRYDFKKFSLGGFYNHPRFFRDIKDEFNIYSTFKIRKESEITAGYLYKTPRTGESNYGNIKLDSDASLPYAAGKFQLSKNVNVSGELAYSKTQKLEGTAYMLQAQATFEKINGNIMYMRASPEFAGYFTNTSTFNGNFQYRILKKLNVFANYIQDARNFQRDTLFLAAPYRKFFQYGLQYNYHPKGFIMLYNGYQKYQDRLEPKEFDYYEKYFKVIINQQIGIFQVNLESQFGKTDNYLTGFNGNSSFYTANIAFEKFRTSFNLYASYAITSRYQLQNQKQVYYGARILNRFSDKTTFSLFYQNNYMPEEYYKDRNLFELLFHQELFPGNELDLSGRYSLQRGELGHKDFIFSLRYTLRLNAPVQKIADYTSLSGNISNLGVQKTEGIKLMLGNYLSVTDKNGNYIFKNIIPGEYILEMDRSSIGMNDITDTSLPASLNLIEKENVFNFGLTTAATIQGMIQLSENESNSSYSFAHYRPAPGKKKKESIIIEASNNEQTFRKIVFLGESFDFTYLRPGEWKVKIFRNGLDKRYKIPIDTFQYTLTPSETKNMSIHIIKQQNEVKYQQETIKVGYNEVKKKK
ncbi:COG1470 family protein [Chryseobacterium sp. CT-SW4]|uniref:COG1470 family protein n=1 Tax=Chryseobacterium sp. SW-1 TaxID=3157343 RepID=UPI003B02AD20